MSNLKIKNDCSKKPKTKTFAFFSVPKNLSSAEQKNKEQEYWKHYLESGGDSKDVPAFLPEMSSTLGYIGRITEVELKSLIMDRCKNPAENINQRNRYGCTER